MTDSNILNALYDNRKQFMLVNYRVHGAKCGFSESLIYATANDLEPIFHDDGERVDPYKECYKIDGDWAFEVVNYVDDKWMKDDPYSFYDLEGKFGGRESRWRLITVLRYCFLDNRFNDEFWKKITEGAPSEGKSIVRELSSWEI